MSGLTLTLREPPTQALDLAPLTPARLAGLGAREIAALALAHGTRRARVGDHFAVRSGDPAHLVIAGGGPLLDGVGAGLDGGRITVEGGVGDRLGLGMRGGAIDVRGGAGRDAAAGMAGGEVTIAGDAGEGLGGPPPGAAIGMRDGVVVVRGDAGARACDRMRRGTVIVEGSLGPYAGSRMLAGTLIGLGAVGPWPGFSMRRGTLLLAGAPSRALPTFADAGAHEILFLAVLLRALAGRSAPLDALGPDAVRVRRLVGDLAAGGRGEMLIWPDRPA